MMEHDATELTAEERRIFAEIERDLDGSPRRRIRDPLRRRQRGSETRPRLWWLVVLLGSALLAGGLWFDAVLLAGVGFVALVVGLSRAIPGGVTRRTLERLRRRLMSHGTAGADDR
jgi:hypothetical protein